MVRNACWAGGEGIVNTRRNVSRVLISRDHENDGHGAPYLVFVTGRVTGLLNCGSDV